MENTALIYCYRQWGLKNVHQDMCVPVIPSIATFRAFDTFTPIYVIDSTDHTTDWFDYPQKLGFKVIKRPHAFKHLHAMCDEITKQSEVVMYWSLLSKPLDVWDVASTLPHKIFVVSDGDIFFLKSLWPLMDDPTKNFVCGSNTGFYYFHKHKPATAQVFETWGSLAALALTHPHIRKKVTSHNYIQEESVYRYMLQCYAARLFLKSIHPYENFLGWWGSSQQPTYDVRSIKVYHATSTFGGREKRSRIALAIKDIRDIIGQVLSKQELEDVFEGFDCPCYPLELSHNFIESVEAAIQ